MKRLLARTIRRAVNKSTEYSSDALLPKNRPNTQVAQVALAQRYRELAKASPRVLPTFAEVGFREYSQFEEDGILLYIFSMISPRSRTCVEICAGNGTECNTANLIINHRWWGALFDGNEVNVEFGRRFYGRHKDTFVHPPRFDHAWITAENVNELVKNTDMTGAIDLLSLDIDGMDYWVWKALNVVDPTVVVCEIQNGIPPELALTVPYDSKFASDDDDYRGASLRAMCHLGREKGYRLVGVHRYGFNAFFIKHGVGEEFFPEVTPESCAQDPFTRQARAERWPRAKDKKWIKV
jgi:hypothetical protein